MRAFAILTILAITMLPSASFGELVKGSRAYVQAERELMSVKKQLTQDQAEVDDFSALLVEMDELRMPRALLHDFWPVNTNVRRAMLREQEQAKFRLEAAKTETKHAPAKARPTQKASMGTAMDKSVDGDSDADREKPAMSATERFERMDAIIRETDGLQRVLANGDDGVAGRYRFLLGEFLQLMRDDVEDTEQHIREDEKQLYGYNR